MIPQVTIHHLHTRDLADEDERIGVIRKNIVIEFSGATYIKSTSKKHSAWRTRRLDTSDEEFIMQALKNIGKKLN